MYSIDCAECGRVGFHPSRVAAESRAESHQHGTGHVVSIGILDDV